MNNGFTIIKLFIFTSCIAMTACSSDESSGIIKLQVRLTDAPGDFEAVNIDIQGMEYHVSGSDLASGWVAVENVNTGVYNLLELTNGVDTLLVDSELSAGKISQIRLILGNDNSVDIDGENFPMSTSSAQQSGLKLNLHEELLSGVTYKILLDFDAARSVKNNGQSYALKPVIRVMSEAQDGALKGNISPIEAFPAIYAIDVNQDSVGTYPDELGDYLIGGLAEGNYTVSFVPIEGFENQFVENIVISTGELLEMDTVRF
jgi:hypothetical protein